jgi:hypothetical protein
MHTGPLPLHPILQLPGSWTGNSFKKLTLPEGHGLFQGAFPDGFLQGPQVRVQPGVANPHKITGGFHESRKAGAGPGQKLAEGVAGL